MSSRPVLLLAAVAVYAAVATPLGGCAPPPQTQLERADALTQDHAWDDALPLVKSYLQLCPDDATGHFLLGKCYLHGSTAYLTLAEGEFQTALGLYTRSGQRGANTRFTTDVQFQVAVYRGLALAGMRRILIGMDNGLPQPILQQLVQRTLEHVRLARQLNPDAPGLADMEQSLEQFFDVPKPLSPKPPEFDPSEV